VRDELAPDAAGEEAEEPGTPARDLLEEAVIAGPGELVGRERELDRVIHILARRTKNNAALIGEAGVGKSAIARGLARRIAAGDVPAPLAERRLVSMDASALAGARERETPFDEPGAIVFIRGLFNLAAAGSAWAAVEAMHAIEPYLARGDIQCIATGSPAGLRETMEKAGMLARHFEVVNVAPASVEEAVRIVTGLKAAFEKFHGVTFAEGAAEAAVAISGRFLPGRHLPDRAIDLVDEAATAVRLRRGGEKTVTVADVEAAVATRAGVPAEAVRRALDEKQAGEAERIAGLLAAQVPAEEGEWVPYLAGWLARHSPEEAEALARAIAAARQPDN
jgi:ATP-dependent Clp protease ATP-binding subunit ClpC